MKIILIAITLVWLGYLITKIARVLRSRRIVRQLKAERDVLQIFNDLWDGRPTSKVYTWRKTLHIVQANHSLCDEPHGKEKVLFARKKLDEAERENPVNTASRSRNRRTIVFETR
jgi:hypothetical protein